MPSPATAWSGAAKALATIPTAGAGKDRALFGSSVAATARRLATELLNNEAGGVP